MPYDIASAIVGAVGGSAVGAVLGQILLAKRERHQDVRTKVTASVATIGTAQQYMEWISWFAVHYPIPNSKHLRTHENVKLQITLESFKSFEKPYSDKMAELVVAYEAEMKVIWPQVLSSLCVLASYNAPSYQKLKTLVDELAFLDVAITIACMKNEAACRTDFEGFPEETANNLGIYKCVRLFGDKLFLELEEISKSLGNEEMAILPK